MTVLVVGSGLVVDRFDQDHPRQAQLLYVMDADRATAMRASRDPVPDAWTAQYVPNAYGETEPPLPLPYGTHPKWIGTAQVIRIDPPRIQLLESRSAGDTTTVKVRVASSRQADVITIHTDRPVHAAIITADGQPPVTSLPAYTDGVGDRAWPYELRFYDPPPDGIAVTLHIRSDNTPRIYVSDYTVGLEQVPGFHHRPPGLDRSPDAQV
jgi:hypothetical protein